MSSINSSNPFHSRIFLPSYVLKFIHDDVDTVPKFDSTCFLSEASMSQVLEIIRLVYPRIRFSKEAADDNLLVQKIFREMVAGHLSSLIIPKDRQPDYLKVLIEFRTYGTQDSEIFINHETVLNTDRIFEFDCLVSCYLNIGQHRLASDNLKDFVKKHKYLTDNELATIDNIYHQALEGLTESVGFIQKSHEEIEGIGILLSDSDISKSRREDLQLGLEAATARLHSRQKSFDSIVNHVGFIQALSQYHRKLALEQLPTPPRSP